MIVLVSAHLESGHYFNPHAQRIIEAKARGAKIVVLDTRLSNTATHADIWASPQPGSEAAIFLSIARHLIEHDLYDAEYVRQWWNWREYLEAKHPAVEPTFASFQRILKALYADYTFAYAEKESGVSAKTIEEIAELVASAGTKLATHNWRSAAAGNLGGWQVSRCLFLLNALMGAIATEGATTANAWNKFVPRPIHVPPHPHHWNGLTWPDEYPLAMNEMSFLLPQLLKDGRGRLDVYFSRVYNPRLDEPRRLLVDRGADGREADRSSRRADTHLERERVLRGLRAADGHRRRASRHPLVRDARRAVAGFRQPVLRAVRERLGLPPVGTRDANPGEVWEENEFWIDLSWRIDPDGALGIRKYFESKRAPGEKLSIDEYYAFIFENSVPGLPEKAAAEGRTPLEYMRRYGAFEIARKIGAVYKQEVPAGELDDVRTDSLGRIYTRAPKPARTERRPAPDAGSRRRGPAARRYRRRRPHGSSGSRPLAGRLEFWSSTLEQWGWPEVAIPTYVKSHVHPERLEPGQMVLIPTFRLPVQIHTRSANAKWLDEIAHTNPLWIHPRDAARLGDLATGDLVRVETEIGHFVVKAWVTEGIRPGVVACSHHMGRWKLGGTEQGQRQMMATVSLERDGARWTIAARRRRRAVRERRRGHEPHLVDRRRRAPEPDLPRSSRSDLRHALLASGRARASAPSRAIATATSPSTPRSRAPPIASGSSSRGRRRRFSRRHATAVLAAPAAQARARRLSPPPGREVGSAA